MSMRVAKRFGGADSQPASAGAAGQRRPEARRHADAARHRGADAMAGAALQPDLSAHRPVEGRRRSRRRRDERALRRGAARAAGEGGRHRGDDRHRRAVRQPLGARDRGPHAQDGAPGGGQSAGHRALHDRVLLAGQVGARGAEDRRELGRGQLRAAGRAGQDQQAARRQRCRRRAGGRLVVEVCVRPARQRHPPRAAARHGR